MTNDVYLKEAFKALRLVEAEESDEDDTKFNLSDPEAYDEMDTAINTEDSDEEDDDVVDVADLDAEDETDFEDSYIGQIILECNVCHSLIYKQPEDITEGSEEDVVCEDEECPFCMCMSGYKVVGQVADWNPDEEVELPDDTEIDGVDDEDIDSETGEAGETIAPLNTTKEGEIAQGMADNKEDDEQEDVDIDDFNEEEFDTEVEESLKSRFNNVSSYRTSFVESRNGKLFVEGNIRFKSGSTKKTHFELRPKTINEKGSVRFLARNSELKETYAITGKVRNKSFIAESFKKVNKKRSGKR